jgi:hypothetical protein
VERLFSRSTQFFIDFLALSFAYGVAMLCHNEFAVSL